MSFGSNHQNRWPASPYSGGWSQRKPVVFWLIVANVGLFVLQLLLERFAPAFNRSVDHWLALSRDGLMSGFLWQTISYMFLHGSVLHLLVNCIGLYFAGREVESMLGARTLLRIYFLGGFIGGLAQLLVGSEYAVVIGASAGVCAVLLAFTALVPEAQITALLFFVLPLRVKAKWLGLGIVALNVIFLLAADPNDPIAHMAHLAGCISGWAYIRLRDFRLPSLRREASSDFISAEIDPILDKIAREGIHSLTRAERRILEKGRDRIANRK